MKRNSKTISMFVVLLLLVSTLFGVNAGAKVTTFNQMDGTWSQEYVIEGYSDEHEFDVSFTSDGLWNCTVMSYCDSLSWELYDSANTKLKSAYLFDGSETNPVTKPIDVVVSAGTYKLRISGSAGKFKINNIFTGYAVNDTAAGSVDSPQMYTLGTTINGAVTINDTEDWFQFNVPDEKYYTISIISYSESVDWEVYNSSRTKLENGYVYNGSETVPVQSSSDFILTPGVHYLKMGDSYIHGRYTFVLQETTKDVCTHSYNYEYVSSTYFAEGYDLRSCKKCGDLVKENFVAKKKLSDVYMYSYVKIKGSKITVSWMSVYDASGYQLRYANNKKFKKAKKFTIKGQKKTSKVIKGIKKGKKYYFQMRAYKKSGNKTVYGDWCSTKMLKIKK